MTEMASLGTDQLHATLLLAPTDPVGIHVQCVDGRWMMKAPESMDWNMYALATQNVMMLQQFQIMIQHMDIKNAENEYLRSKITALETTIHTTLSQGPGDFMGMHGMSLQNQSHLKNLEINVQQLSRLKSETEMHMKQKLELEERVKSLLEEMDDLKSTNQLIQDTFLTHQEKEKTWKSVHLDLESQYSTLNSQKSELDIEIANLKKEFEKKTDNLRKSSESQRTMSARIRELENEQSSLSYQNQRLQDEVSEKTRLIEKIRSTPAPTPAPTPVVSGPSSEEKRLKDRLTSLESELKQARQKAREFDRLKPIFDEVEMDYSLMKAHRGTYEEALNALTNAHDEEMSKLNSSLIAKDLIIKQQEDRMKQMSLQNQRALRELGETEKTSIQAVRELERKLQVAHYDLSSLRERNKHSEKDLHEACATKEELNSSREEVSSLQNRMESFERISNDAVQRLKSVIRKKNELQTQLDGAKTLIERYRVHIGDLPEESEKMVKSESSDNGE